MVVGGHLHVGIAAHEIEYPPHNEAACKNAQHRSPARHSRVKEYSSAYEDTESGNLADTAGNEAPEPVARRRTSEV